jgi:hypothetical protein
MSGSFEKHWVTANSMRTICEVLREIYWQTEDPIVREKVMEAERMAKSMNRKLEEYNQSWIEGTFEHTKNPEGITKERQEQSEKEKEPK